MKTKVKIKLADGKKAIESDIQKLENTIGLPINPEVRSFVQKFDGAVADSNVFQVGADNASCVQYFIPVSEIPNDRNFIDSIGYSSYPIAYDGGGNFVIVDEGKGGEIYFWDHDTNDRSTKLADSFDLFPEMLEPFDLAKMELDPDDVKAVWIDPEFEQEMIAKGILTKK